MMNTLVVPVGRWGPPALSWSVVTRRRVFQKRLDRLYTAASEGPSNLSVVSEGPYHASVVAFSSGKGRTAPAPGTLLLYLACG